jgi:glutamate synthase domain-containing protein 2
MSKRQFPPLPYERRVYSRVPDFIEKWSPRVFFVTVLTGITATVLLTIYDNIWWSLLIAPGFVFLLMGARDYAQPHHAILRNYPVLGHLRYVLESLRPEFRQYFVESDAELTPFPRADRNVVYQRAKGALDTQPFGTRLDLYAVGHEWISHSLQPRVIPPEDHRVMVGAETCDQPYLASLLNVSAMSFGSLSKNAVLALNGGAAAGGFYHNTGEGGISPYHLEPGGDLVWQIGTGYFGCRSSDGGFDPDKFKSNAARDSVKMIEVKLSQGAKPAHGGILPGKKVTAEIAAIRGVEVGKDVNSPPAHTAFDGPRGLLEFVTALRELCGKPVGFTLCIGNPVEFLMICHVMLQTDLHPDFITVDGAEGGTGAAPIEFANVVGWPLDEGLSFVHNALIGCGMREKIRLISAGKIATGFHLVRHLALGADLCNSARAMMMAVGCIQALKCNTNHCPVGVATQDERLMRGLVVATKSERVHNFQHKTVEAAMELVGAAGIAHSDALRPYHVMRRVSQTSVRDLSAIYPRMRKNAFVEECAPTEIQRLWELARERTADEQNSWTPRMKK